MKSLHLSEKAQAVLTRIRTYPWVLSVFGMSPSRAWRLVQAKVERHINTSGVMRQQVNQYRRYVHELLKLFRTQFGPLLARDIELVIRKWANFGLNPTLLQDLLCICFLRFEQVGYIKPWSNQMVWPKKRGPKSRRLPRRSYEKALRKGRIPLSPANTVEEQTARHAAGSRHAAEIAAKLRPVLDAADITGDQFVRYYAFAQKLGSLSRRYSGRSLRRAASDLIDLYEAKSLNPDVLATICSQVFNISPVAP